MASESDKPSRAARRAAYWSRVEHRLNTCKDCPAYRHHPPLPATCEDCGCLVHAKSLLPGEACPRGRW